MSTSQRVSTISPLDIRNDLHLTSTGIGHAYLQDTSTFPPEHIKDIFNKPLPSIYGPLTSRPSDQLRTDTLFRSNYYPKTGADHSRERLYKKSPSLLKLNYNNDTLNKLSVKSWCPPLTMGNQRSETRDKYEGKRPLRQQTQSYLMDPTLYDHHTEGITKRLQSTTINKSLKGEGFHIEDQSIHHCNQPYITTHGYYHRAFPYKEVTGYPKKDGATYWVCEDYPKAWGHGTKESPLPKLSSQQPHEGPMIDGMIFKSKTHIVPTREQGVQLTSNGLRTEYQRCFLEQPRHDIFKQLAEPLIIRTDKDSTLMSAVPRMYSTTNGVYGTFNLLN